MAKNAEKITGYARTNYAPLINTDSCQRVELKMDRFLFPI